MNWNTDLKGSNPFWKALLACWVTIIFGTSILIQLSGRGKYQYYANPILNGLRNIWEIADAMGPTVKLSVLGLFCVLLFLSKILFKTWTTLLGSILCACGAVVIILAFMPKGYSRGYGIGLDGLRFGYLTPAYILGAFSGGSVFYIVYHRISHN